GLMLLIRVDAAPDLGFGHLTRMIYLASQIRHRGEVVFAVRENKDASRLLGSRRIDWRPAGEVWKSDLAGCSGVLFDLRHFTTEDESLLARARGQAIPTLQVTDLGLERRAANWLVDAAIAPEPPYPPATPGLLGPQAAILHHSFRHFHQVPRKYQRRNRHLLLTLGGGASYRDLRRLIDLLYRHGFLLKIALGFSTKKAVGRVLRRLYPGIHFVGAVQSLARPLFEADTAILAPGVAAFEAAACGTPAIYLSHDPYQGRHAAQFAAAGAGIDLGLLATLDEAALLSTLAGMTQGRRSAMGTAGKELVDGQGTRRLIDLLTTQEMIR
ncbi:MAG TPA: hypothetical protein PKK12_15515, partial [Candidatus Aminicenantes bacterium]|nr:hypothetical protein [Candidatus Aminicenantes bacterium]